ncbi:hypothetical protein [Paucibacter sp. M5-1]|uniref:hypothetical protein n=1 Tax=Paucibacter sp. M5-1 TaxID=3015998 RepID=UPI0022B861E6|nr:hypothetical protein [Paucibacter sp. M5-1]MCZ7884380.1 hypothetical protein [Paucibacter sp. M5-1]
MHTDLDSLHELELDRCVYDGRTLVAEVNELIVGYGGRVVRGPRRYGIRFARPVAHAVTEELPAAVAALLQAGDGGFLRNVEASALRVALGLDLEQFEGLLAFALVTAHEVLVAYCTDEPIIEERGG